MSESDPIQLRFPSMPGFTIRGDFDGGTMSSDFGPIILRNIDKQIGLTQRLADAFDDRRHPAYIEHSIRDLFAQRIFQIASGYEDCNDSNKLRKDPMFKIGLDKKPIDEISSLASAATFSRLENAATTKDVYRIGKALVEQFIVSYTKPPEVIVLDMDHSEDKTHGQQQFAVFNGYYGNECYLPLFIFEGLSGKLITAILRPGKRPAGEENAMIISRVMKAIRSAWPETHIILRGDSHFSNPELMHIVLNDANSDFIFGVGGNSVLSRLSSPCVQSAKQLHNIRCANEKTISGKEPSSTVFYSETEYAAGSWPQPFRVIFKVEVDSLRTDVRAVVTTFKDQTPEIVYKDLYCPRGQDENYIKAMKNDFHSDRTSCHTFLANHMRLFFSCAAYILMHTLRSEVLTHTELAKAQAGTIVQKLFKIAVRVVQYKDRIKLHLPTSCTVKHILYVVAEILFRIPVPAPSTA